MNTYVLGLRVRSLSCTISKKGANFFFFQSSYSSDLAVFLTACFQCLFSNPLCWFAIPVRLSMFARWWHWRPKLTRLRPVEALSDRTSSVHRPVDTLSDHTSSVRRPVETLNDRTSSMHHPEETLSDRTYSVYRPVETLSDRTSSVYRPVETLNDYTSTVDRASPTDTASALLRPPIDFPNKTSVKPLIRSKLPNDGASIDELTC